MRVIKEIWVLQMCGAVTYCGERGLAFFFLGRLTRRGELEETTREKEQEEGGPLHRQFLWPVPRLTKSNNP